MAKVIPHPSIFVSHSEKDNEKIVHRIRNILKWGGFYCYLAEEDYEGGKRIWDKIHDAILQSDFFLLIWTEESKKSQYVNQEIGAALELKPEKVIVTLAEEGVEIKGGIVGRDTIFFNERNFYDKVNELLSYLRSIASEMGIIPKPQTVNPNTSIGKIILGYLNRMGLENIKPADLGIIFEKFEKIEGKENYAVFEVSYRPGGMDFDRNSFGEFKVDHNSHVVDGPSQKFLEHIVAYVESQRNYRELLGVYVSPEIISKIDTMPIESYGGFILLSLEAILQSLNLLWYHEMSPKAEFIFKKECDHLYHELGSVIQVDKFSPNKEIEKSIEYLSYGICTYQGSIKIEESHVKTAIQFFAAILYEILRQRGKQVSTLPRPQTISRHETVVRMFRNWRLFARIPEKDQHTYALILQIKDYAKILYALSIDAIHRSE